MPKAYINQPTEEDITFDIGSQLPILASHTVNGVAVDITGWTGLCQLKFNPSLPAVDASFTFAVTDGPTGKFSLIPTLPFTQTPGDYHYDIFCKNTDSPPKWVRVGVGCMTLNAPVSNIS